MKKIFFNTLALLVGVTMLSSCLKDDTMVLDPDKSTGNTVEFGNTASWISAIDAPVFVFPSTSLDPSNVPVAKFTTSVRYAGAENEAPEDITVNIALAPEAVTKYNAKYPAAAFPYNTFPASILTFPSSVVIKKGTKVTYFDVTIQANSGLIQQALANVVPLKITSTTLGTISGNFGAVIYNVPIKSIWEGTYTQTVENNFGVLNASIGVAPYTETGKKLVTIAPNRVQAQLVALTYSGSTFYQFDSSNTAITAVGATSGSTVLTGASVTTLAINSTTKNFKLSYILQTQGWGIVETFTRTGN
jgi:hypothetical protein